MSYRFQGLGAAMPDCSEYITTASGICADDTGLYTQRWFSLRSGRCEPWPGIVCPNEPDLPASCPAGQKLFSGSPTGCKPSAAGGAGGGGGGGGAGTQGTTKAGVGLGVLAIVLGVGLYAAGKLGRARR
jgi:hypothetical protein